MTHEAAADYQGAKMGMWLFLFTEILLFGGLFVLYAAYLHRYPIQFHEGGLELNVVMGAVNTVVLITSSLCVALAVSALQRGQKALSLRLLAATIALAAVFMVIKFFEWSAKHHHGLFPGLEHFDTLPPGQGVFFSLYYSMTGLHGLHVVVGALVLGWTMLMIHKGRCTQDDFVLLENAGLYWHLVDLVWIYLFPLFYLIA